MSVPEWLKPWLPMCSWFATTIGFFIAIAFWRKEVFQGLDDLASYLKEEGYYGHMIMFFLILLTTFPPLPLYSTFMMLSGYTYGSLTGFYISYTSSLVGATIVFLIFRYVVPVRWTMRMMPASLKRVVRVIEERWVVFLLVRVAPYPFNVVNAVLGSGSGMELRVYLGVTGVSLLKVLVHTSIGSGIRSFRDYHSSSSSEGGSREWTWKEIWGLFGILLCVGLFVYLGIVARRAVDELEAEVQSRSQCLEEGPLRRHSSVIVGGTGEEGMDEGAVMRSVSPGVHSSTGRGYERVPMTETPYGIHDEQRLMNALGIQLHEGPSVALASV
ncbi:uncharacterized protein EI90DRAFT_2904003 [Cantharellus anzutake]|uniref:uncharacterized protein n=1 Tax=Cantharellus anzutake TaxID=1750568 RepID=UPI0019047FFE|nr:uncharacterized protein EI90DRAFT_2904003 [Cantharellus anzutake]KAF8341987.1 hypothetical protein EI90DRAFT_2904003 [Cantharellus anzutake]